jgi:hypothetical protein
MNNKLIVVCLSLIVTLCVSCSRKSDPNTDVGKDTHNLKYQKICSLKENLFLIGNIESFDIIDNEHFVVATSKPSNVIIFDKNGQQVKKIGNEGKGPFEYQNPNIIQIHNDKIYVWDADQLKLIVYDNLGNSIEEYNDFKVAIDNFKIIKNLACFYFGGGFSGMIGVYDLSKKQYVFKGGNTSEEHLLLNLNRGAGGMTLFNEGMVYMSADQLSLNYLDLNNFEERTLAALIDNEFKVENITNAKEIINSNMTEAIKYITTNSYVTGLFMAYDNLVIKAEVGKFTKDINHNNDNSERFNKYYFLNNRMKLVKIVKSQHDFHENNKLFGSYNNELYCVIFNSTNNLFNYEINKLSFEEIDE